MVDILSWDKSIDKEVKSEDDKNLGKIKAVSNDFIKIQKGSLDKKYYFVPKYYMQGYDGKHIWLSLTKDEVNQFESENESSIGMFDDDKYKQRKSTVDNAYPDFARTIPSFKSSNEARDSKIGMPWDEIIGAEVKSADNKDLGEVKSISPDYVEVTKGSISKKHYYIPKVYIAEYKDEKVYSRLTEEEIKNKFERDSPPLASEFRSSEFENTRNNELIPMMAKEPGLELRDQTGDSLKIPWEEIIHKHVRSSDNIDIGDVDKVGNEFIVVREGVVTTHMYYIPKQYINRYDGSSLWINEPSALISGKFERKEEPTQEEINMLVRDARDKFGTNRS